MIVDIDCITKMKPLAQKLEAAGVSDWCRLDTTIVRGLAYYTGTVFEVIVAYDLCRRRRRAR